MALENAEQPEPSEVPVVEEVVTDASVDPPSSVEPVETVEAPEALKPAEPPKKEVAPALIREIAEQREKRRAAERELADLRAQLEAARKPPEGQPQPPAPRANQDEQIKLAVARELYNRSVNNVTERGHREFGAGEFNAAAQRFVDNVGMEARDGLVNDIMDIAGEKAHRVIHELSNDPERSLFIRDMSPAKRAIAIHEMVQMAEKPAEVKSPLASPASKAVSKAPPPAPKIAQTTAAEKVQTWASSDKMSEDEFTAWFNERQKSRRGMHR